LPSLAVMVGEDETKRLSKIDFVEGLPPMPPRRPPATPAKRQPPNEL
jgi:hypothetical protein